MHARSRTVGCHVSLMGVLGRTTVSSSLFANKRGVYAGRRSARIHVALYVHARVASDEERARLWPEFVSFFAGYDFYARNAQSRTIPIVILEPR
jgi:F420H(2)-dependent quinone reductase